MISASKWRHLNGAWVVINVLFSSFDPSYLMSFIFATQPKNVLPTTMENNPGSCPEVTRTVSVSYRWVRSLVMQCVVQTAAHSSQEPSHILPPGKTSHDVMRLLSVCSLHKASMNSVLTEPLTALLRENSNPCMAMTFTPSSTETVMLTLIGIHQCVPTQHDGSSAQAFVYISLCFVCQIHGIPKFTPHASNQQSVV